MVPALFVIAFASAVAQLIVLGALPTFAAELDVSGAQVTWLLTAFMLVNGVTTPIVGRLGDMYGYRLVLTVTMLIFVVGTAICVAANLAGSYPGSLLGRSLQGISGGVFPLIMGTVRATVPTERALPMIGVIATMTGIGGAMAMVFSGPLAGLAGTTSLYWLTLALAGAGLLGIPLIPDTRPSKRGRLDIPGALLLSGSMCALLIAVTQGKTWGWDSDRIIGLFVGSAVLMMLFVLLELRVTQPLIDVRLMSRRSLSANNSATVVIAAALFGVMTLQSQYVQAPSAGNYGFGLSLSESGIVMAPIAIMMVAGSRKTAAVNRRIGGRATFQLGALLLLISAGYMVVEHHRLIDFFIAGAIAGVAYGLCFASIGTLVAAAVEKEYTGVATGVNSVLRTLGGAIGAQIVAAILIAHTAAGERLPDSSGYDVAFGVCALFAAGAFAATLLIPRDRVMAAPAARPLGAARPAAS
jgi:MFS family permease